MKIPGGFVARRLAAVLVLIMTMLVFEAGSASVWADRIPEASRIPAKTLENFEKACRPGCEARAKELGKNPAVCEARCKCVGQQLQESVTNTEFQEAEVRDRKNLPPSAEYQTALKNAALACPASMSAKPAAYMLKASKATSHAINAQK